GTFLQEDQAVRGPGQERAAGPGHRRALRDASRRDGGERLGPEHRRRAERREEGEGDRGARPRPPPGGPRRRRSTPQGPGGTAGTEGFLEEEFALGGPLDGVTKGRHHRCHGTVLLRIAQPDGQRHLWAALVAERPLEY